MNCMVKKIIKRRRKLACYEMLHRVWDFVGKMFGTTWTTGKGSEFWSLERTEVSTGKINWNKQCSAFVRIIAPLDVFVWITANVSRKNLCREVSSFVSQWPFGGIGTDLRQANSQYLLSLWRLKVGDVRNRRRVGARERHVRGERRFILPRGGGGCDYDFVRRFQSFSLSSIKMYDVER
jgi:hypothetical protein